MQRPTSPRSRNDRDLLTQVRRSAMATEFAVLLPDHVLQGDGGRAVEIAVDALETVEQLERRFSVYMPESEISRINARAASDPVPVSGETLAILQLAQEMAARTEGAFDVTTGPLVDCWGFTRRTGRKPAAREIEEALARVGWQKLELDASRSTVHFSVSGMRINLGGIGKGFAIDRIADQLHREGVHDFLIHGGNSSVLASGSSTADEPERGWLIGVMHPKLPRRRLGGLWLKNQALGTSGPGKRFFHHRGKRYGHVLDPRSGWPAGDLEALTLIADSAAAADALATGWFVAGKEAALQAVAADSSMAAVAVEAADRQSGVRLHVVHLGDGGWVTEQVERMD